MDEQLRLAPLRYANRQLDAPKTPSPQHRAAAGLFDDPVEVDDWSDSFDPWSRTGRPVVRAVGWVARLLVLLALAAAVLAAAAYAFSPAVRDIVHERSAQSQPVVIAQRGDTSDHVREIQSLLRDRWGFDALAVDSSFGPKTEQAVKDFQASQDLAITGVVDHDTYQALRDA